jgi:phenylacetic acid degradation operon negative regulatory protein
MAVFITRFDLNSQNLLFISGMDDTNLTARQLILALLDSAPAPQIQAASLIAAGALFGMDPGAIRVATARLVRDRVLESTARGQYTVGGGGAGLHRTVLSWADLEETLKPWAGEWLAVYLGSLKRTNKTLVRARERALQLKGFVTVDPGLAVRPANLKASLPELLEDLRLLGLDPSAGLYRIAETADGSRFAGLWDTDGLARRYQRHIDEIARSTRGIAELSPRAAAKETLLVGRAAIRDILRDPLLPAELVDSRLRRELVHRMKKYDRLGKSCWRAFYADVGKADQR